MAVSPPAGVQAPRKNVIPTGQGTRPFGLFDPNASQVEVRDGVAVAVSTAAQVPPRMPDGVERPQPGPVPAVPPVPVQASSRQAMPAAASSPTPNPSALIGAAEACRDQCNSAIMALQQQVIRALSQEDPNRAALIKGWSEAAQRIAELAHRTAGVAQP